MLAPCRCGKHTCGDSPSSITLSLIFTQRSFWLKLIGVKVKVPHICLHAITVCQLRSRPYISCNTNQSDSIDTVWEAATIWPCRLTKYPLQLYRQNSCFSRRPWTSLKHCCRCVIAFDVSTRWRIGTDAGVVRRLPREECSDELRGWTCHPVSIFDVYFSVSFSCRQ